MGSLMLYNDTYSDFTMVSNRFIDEYMKDANDAQIKVFLFLLRISNSSVPTSISDMADRFNHTEKDILRALMYWEKQKIMRLEFGDGRILTGIHFCDPGGYASSAQPDATADRTPSGAASAATEAPSIAVPSPYEKPSFSLDELKDFREKESSAQLLFIAEQYLGKTLSAADIRSILFLSEKLSFSDDLIDFLLQYCVERGKKDFRYIEKVAISWAEGNITNPGQARIHTSKYEKSVYTVMKALGKASTPTEKEVDYINRWNKEYGFEQDIIIEACERCVLATDKHRFEYTDKILSSWKQSGVHHKSDIVKIDENYQKNKIAASARQAPSGNKFNQFKQTTYDFDAIEKAFLSN